MAAAIDFPLAEIQWRHHLAFKTRLLIEEKAWRERRLPQKSATLRDLRELGPSAVAEVLRYLGERIRGAAGPATFGKPLRADRHGDWRYHVRAPRSLCNLQIPVFIVAVVAVVDVVVAVGHP